MVDTTDQTITVTRNKRASASRSGALIDPSKTLDAWLQSGGKLSGGELTPDGRYWTLDSGKPTTPKTQMYVDGYTHLLRRLVYESEGPKGIRTKVDIRYSWGDPARLNPADFETNRFIQEQGGIIAPVKAYAQYRIIRTDRE